MRRKIKLAKGFFNPKNIESLIEHATFPVYGLVGSPFHLMVQSYIYEIIGETYESYGFEYGEKAEMPSSKKMHRFFLTSGNRDVPFLSLDEIREDLIAYSRPQNSESFAGEKVAFWEGSVEVYQQTFQAKVWMIPLFRPASRFHLIQKDLTLFGRAVGYTLEDLQYLFSLLTPLNGQKTIIQQYQQECDFYYQALRASFINK